MNRFNNVMSQVIRARNLKGHWAGGGGLLVVVVLGS